MFGQITKTRVIFFIAIIIGSIGAVGQAYLLHHELVDCYPYKLMDWHFYDSIAEFGIYFAPTVAIICGILFGLKRFWFSTIVPVVFCPLIFSLILKAFLVCGIDMSKAENTIYFDGKTIATATQDFYLSSLNLSIFSLVIGGVCSFILSRFSIGKKLP